jgi:steroid delta-isomerase-like uncharacterized protein
VTAAATRALIQRYYDAFNAGDVEAMLDCVGDDLLHDVSQGEQRVGKVRFAAFLRHMNERYRERLSDIVIMTTADGARAAAEFDLHGTYLKTDEGLPEACGQTYRLRVGAFFAIADGKIARVSTHYNLQDWIDQVKVKESASHDGSRH